MRKPSLFHEQDSASLHWQNNLLGCLKIHLDQEEQCLKNNADLYSVYLCKILGVGDLKSETLGENRRGWCLLPEFSNPDKLQVYFSAYWTITPSSLSPWLSQGLLENTQQKHGTSQKNKKWNGKYSFFFPGGAPCLTPVHKLLVPKVSVHLLPLASQTTAVPSA